MGEKAHNVYRNRKKMLVDNFLGGIAWSVGITIGGAVTIALIAFIVSSIDYIPVIGDIVLRITEYIAENQEPFHNAQ